MKKNPLETSKLYRRIKRFRKKKILRIKSIFSKPNENPVIIMGNQKSGTTAIAALLAMYIKKNVTLDFLPINNEIDALLLKEKEFSSFVNHYSILFSTYIIKEPWLTFIASQVYDRFPKARYILIVRDPRDNIRSILDRLNIPGNKENNPDEINNLKPGWKQVFIPELYHWNCKNYIEILSNRWNYAINIKEYIQSKKIIVVRYEDFKNNKIRFIKDLATKIGEKGQEDISAFINKQFQPMGASRNIPWKDIYGEENLEKIEKICKSNMKRYDYY